MILRWRETVAILLPIYSLLAVISGELNFFRSYILGFLVEMVISSYSITMSFFNQFLFYDQFRVPNCIGKHFKGETSREFGVVSKLQNVLSSTEI